MTQKYTTPTTTLVELATKWKNKELTEAEFIKEAKLVEIWVPKDLETETDEDIQISISGNSWIEVDEEVFPGEYETYDLFYKEYYKAIN